ncbi:MAG: hypothetical protein ACREA5_03695 [Nitrosotalea sp.]
MVIEDVLVSTNFADYLNKRDGSFKHDRKSLATNINEYAVEKGLWTGVPVGTLMKDLRDFDTLVEALLDKDPLDVKGNTALRHEIIIKIIDEPEFVNEYQNDPDFRFTKTGLGSKINNYALKHGLWAQGLATTTLRNDLTLIQAEIGPVMRKKEEK